MSCAITVCALPIIMSSSVNAQQNLVTGKEIGTLPGVEQSVGSLPMNMVLSADGKYVISTDMGFRESIWATRVSDGKGVSHIDFANDTDKSNGLFYGLAAAKDGLIYASQGAHGSIAVLSITSDGQLSKTGTITAGKYDFVAGLAADDNGLLYAVTNMSTEAPDPDKDPPIDLPSYLTLYNRASGSALGRLELGSIRIPSAFGSINPTSYALSVAVLRDGSKAYVGSQRDSVVDVIDVSNPSDPKKLTSIPTGTDPDSLLLNKDQTRLYVANANSDTLSIVDTRTDHVISTLLLRPPSAQDLPTASPTSLALSANEKTLYVTLSDMNCIGVVDTAAKKLDGYIPVGWYPSSVISVGSHLVVSNAKGVKARNPNSTKLGPNGSWGTYVQNIIEGSVEVFSVPTAAQLKVYTSEVLKYTHLTQAPRPNAALLSLKGKIKHVIYIVKENRTYDQILGDVREGNGDPDLAEFGGQVTPNQHALAHQFVLLDNFYDCGEVSGDGWTWSTASMANEAMIKAVPYQYSGRGRNYDYEGQTDGYPVGGLPAKDAYGEPMSKAFPNGAPAIPDVAATRSGRIWDTMRRSGLSYRNYGFFLTNGVDGYIPDNYPDATGVRPGGHDLGGISDVDFRRFDTDYADSDAGQIYFERDHNVDNLSNMKTFGHYNASSRASEWLREYHEMEKKGLQKSFPAFMTIRLMNDHTSGADSGGHTPRSYVADNDYAVGQIVDKISHSAIWSSTAIFIIEDDSQHGQDHVDCHRSTCFVISPYIKAGTVDHTFYNTDSVLRTMELLFGAKPLTTYDATAQPFEFFQSSIVNRDTFKAILPSESIIAERNPKISQLSRNDPRLKLALLSAKMDFKHPDSAPAQLLNSIIWKTVKGPYAVSPPPVNCAIAPKDPSDDDGDGS